MLLNFVLCFLSCQTANLTATEVASIFAVEKPIEPKYVGQVDVSADYSLRFRITPKSTSTVWTNILMAMDKDTTADGLVRSRMMGIWFVPGTTGLHVRTGTDVDWNEGIDQIPALPLNVATTVLIQTAGKIVRVSYNGEIVAEIMLKGTRLTGMANLYASSTLSGHLVPDALFGTFFLVARTGGLPIPANLIIMKRAVVNTYGGVLEVPADWTLSFQITPQAISPGWTNVLWLMDKDTNADALPRSSMIGIWFVPGTTALHVRTGTDVDRNEGFDKTPPLPLNVPTEVTIETAGNIVRVTYNGKVVAAMILKGNRLIGMARLYVARDHVPAALFGKLSLVARTGELLPTPYDQFGSRIMVVNGYGGIVNIPADWTLSFQIYPLSISSGWTNVLWLMNKDTNADALPRARMIGIWFWPGTTKLHVRTGTDVSWNAGVDPTATLPLNAATVVKVEAFGQTVRISFNNNEVASDVLPGTRLSGFAHLYVAKDVVPNALFGKLSFA